MFLKTLAQLPVIEIIPFATGFTKPTNIQNAGDDRLFIVEQEGTIKILNEDGTTNATPFLDLDVNFVGENGLLGLAFHPDYANNGYFFVYYSNTADSNLVSRFSVSDNADIADPASELPILSIPKTNSTVIHNGGSIVFDPNGYLLISVGDHAILDGTIHTTLNYYGKILRIDPNNFSDDMNYSIPPDNPYINDQNSLQEIWATGLRNPWKISIDAITNSLYISDVGAGDFEEINRVGINDAQVNYGWPCYEGYDEEFLEPGCSDTSNLTFPLTVYSHDNDGLSKCSITGGFVYRGNLFPNMQGLYFFGDYCSGEIGYLTEDNNIFFSAPTNLLITSFGIDNTGELYVAGRGSGDIQKVVQTGTLSLEKPLLSALKVFPNPIKNNQLTLQYPTFEKADQFNIYDITGKLVQSQTIQSSETSFSVAQLPAGVYIAHMSRNPQTLKLVIQ